MSMAEEMIRKLGTEQAGGQLRYLYGADGETLEALGEAADGWLQVQWNGYAGYVSADMVQMDDGAGGTSCQIWYVHVPCQNRQQAEALADLIPGAIAVVSSGND